MHRGRSGERRMTPAAERTLPRFDAMNSFRPIERRGARLKGAWQQPFDES